MRKIISYQLFEAIQSKNISRTLGFIKQNSRNEFLADLKNIANRLDFPLSELSDEFFQYLPFRKALYLNQNLEDEPCEATSEGEFPDYAVSGSKCNGTGKLLRKWGLRNRSVVCPVCKGTGAKPRTNYEIKWIKFWFDKDGKYVKVTGTDGKIRPQTETNEIFHDLDTSWSRNFEDYDVIKTIELRELLGLPSGCYVRIKLRGGREVGRQIARTWASGGHKIFILQDNNDGSEPPDFAWQQFANHSWVVTSSGGELYGSVDVLIPKSKNKNIESEADIEINPYDWNNLIDLSRPNLNIESSKKVKDEIKDAHFALVLDYLELRKSVFKPRTDISVDRIHSKLGATALMKDEEIKKKNLERYLQQLTQKLDIKTDLSNMKSVVLRFFGYDLIGWYLLKGTNSDTFRSFMKNLLSFLKTGDPDYYENCMNHYQYVLKENVKRLPEFRKTIEDIRKECETFQEGRLRGCFTKLEELTEVLRQKVNSYTIETYQDLESFYLLILSIRSGMTENRYEIKHVYRAIDNMRLGETRPFFYYFEDIESEDVTEQDLESYKKVIERILR